MKGLFPRRFHTYWAHFGTTNSHPPWPAIALEFLPRELPRGQPAANSRKKKTVISRKNKRPQQNLGNGITQNCEVFVNFWGFKGHEGGGIQLKSERGGGGAKGFFRWSFHAETRDIWHAGIQSAIYGGCALPTVLGIGVLCLLREGLNSQLSAVQAEMSGWFSLFLTSWVHPLNNKSLGAYGGTQCVHIYKYILTINEFWIHKYI